MGHYECKRCGRYYDDCTCGDPPPLKREAEMMDLKPYEETKTYKNTMTTCKPFELARATARLGDKTRTARVVVVGKRGLADYVDVPEAVVEVLGEPDRLGGERWVEALDVNPDGARLAATLVMQERAAALRLLREVTGPLCGAEHPGVDAQAAAGRAYASDVRAGLATSLGESKEGTAHHLVVRLVETVRAIAKRLGVNARLDVIGAHIDRVVALVRPHGARFVAQHLDGLLVEGRTVPEALRALADEMARETSLDAPAGTVGARISAAAQELEGRLGVDGIGWLTVYYRDRSLEVWPRRGGGWAARVVTDAGLNDVNGGFHEAPELWAAMDGVCDAADEAQHDAG